MAHFSTSKIGRAARLSSRTLGLPGCGIDREFSRLAEIPGALGALGHFA
jgi:hypothetical protein